MDNLEIIDSCIYNLINKEIDLLKGVQDIKTDISNYFKGFEVDWLDTESAQNYYNQFEKWLIELLEMEPINKEIIALNFGLFEKEDGIQLYISGSSKWDENNHEWAETNEYFPEGRYASLGVFEKINETNNENEWLAIYLSLAVTALFIKNFDNKFSGALSKEGKTLHLATGFDDGVLYNIR